MFMPTIQITIRSTLKLKTLCCCLMAAVIFLPTPPAEAARNLRAGIQFNASSYRLGPGDVLSLTVLPQEKFSTPNILIRSDGFITVPGAGEIQVAGNTVMEATDKIAERLSVRLRNADVTLSLLTPRSATVYLAGAVMHPGSFQMLQNPEQSNTEDKPAEIRLDMLLSNVLANAGGLLPTADLAHVRISRGDSGIKQEVDFWRILREGEADQDVWVNPGDSITVPYLKDQMAMSDEDFQLYMRSSLAPKTIPVRVIGHAVQPNIIELDSQSPFLNTAIAKAGGYAPEATRHAVAIRRFTTDTKFSTLFVDPAKIDFVLRPNDVIYIGENKVYKSGRFMQQAAMILSPFQSAATIGAFSSQTFGIGGWKRRNQF